MVKESRGKVVRNKDQGGIFIRYVKSFGHALAGLKYSFLNEHNTVIIFFAIIITTIGGFYFNVNNYEWLFIITSFGMVLGCELVNGAVEATIDLVTSDYHPLAKIAKDLASSATLIFSLTSFIGALIIFIPKIF